MKQDEGRGPQENTELYRAAMNHLRLPEDFEQRTLELAKKRHRTLLMKKWRGS